jgi:hypothetical protein
MRDLHPSALEVLFVLSQLLRQGNALGLRVSFSESLLFPKELTDGVSILNAFI